MISPYFNTKLSTTIILKPHQMNNAIYLNLKKNLEEKIVGKCYNKYGYVMKIIQIFDYKDGIIEAENIDSSALFSLDFSCRLCLPLKGMTIICRITNLNKALILAHNGPIIITITNNRINNELFFKDHNDNTRYKKGNESYQLKKEDFIKITIETAKFFNNDEQINVIAFLNDMASEDEIKFFYDDTYKDTNYVDYETFISQSSQTKI